MVDRRHGYRHRTLKGGTVNFDPGVTVDCVVRNISTLGACLEVESPASIPDDFTLILAKDQTKHPCHVTWRTGRRIGVRFK